MLLIVSAVAVLLGVSQWMSPISFAALLLLILSIIAHVAGNVIGTKLRARHLARKRLPAEAEEPRTLLQDHHFAPTTKLGHHQSLGWLPLLSGLGGFLFGAAAGSLWTVRLLEPDFDWGTIALAASAFGALGGFGGFLLAGFGKAFSDAWQQASQNVPASEAKDEREERGVRQPT
jgi:hypothetical protein